MTLLFSEAFDNFLSSLCLRSQLNKKDTSNLFALHSPLP